MKHVDKKGQLYNVIIGENWMKKSTWVVAVQFFND